MSDGQKMSTGLCIARSFAICFVQPPFTLADLVLGVAEELVEVKFLRPHLQCATYSITTISHLQPLSDTVPQLWMVQGSTAAVERSEPLDASGASSRLAAPQSMCLCTSAACIISQIYWNFRSMKYYMPQRYDVRKAHGMTERACMI